MSAAVLLRDIVRETQHGLLVGIVPLHRHLDRDAFPVPLRGEHVGVQDGFCAVHVFDKAPHTARKGEVFFFAGTLIDQNNLRAVIEKRELPQPARKDVVVVVDIPEYDA